MRRVCGELLILGKSVIRHTQARKWSSVLDQSRAAGAAYRSGGASSNCSSESVISCHGALERAQTCAIGHSPGSPSTVPRRIRTSPNHLQYRGEPQREQNTRILDGECSFSE